MAENDNKIKTRVFEKKTARSIRTEKKILNYE